MILADMDKEGFLVVLDKQDVSLDEKIECILYYLQNYTDTNTVVHTTYGFTHISSKDISQIIRKEGDIKYIEYAYRQILQHKTKFDGT